MNTKLLKKKDAQKYMSRQLVESGTNLPLWNKRLPRLVIIENANLSY